MFKFLKSKKEPLPKQDLLLEEKEFYIENGNHVFTEYGLKKRGYCCKNRCRHCPYGVHNQ